MAEALTESDVAAELYGGSREDFTATRSARAGEARAAGDRELAKRITALRKPTVAAWLVNQMVRRYPDEMASLAELADELESAQRQGFGEQLRSAGQRRRELLRRLDVAVRELARDNGMQLGADAAGQVATTFQAALVDPGALHEVLTGQLSAVLDVDPNGIGQWQSERVSRPPVRTPPDERPDPKAEAALAQARSRAEDAAAARSRAEDELAQAQEIAAKADEALAEARARLDEAQAEQHRTRDAVQAAKKTLTRAGQEAKQADTALARLEAN
ncbi:MAG TPA: hypothetical protein VHV49_17705 [Pseudonocardiaceae bacterium]|nr:hypothetical protein [Pseudonocardiaceae bacterium]